MGASPKEKNLLPPQTNSPSRKSFPEEQPVFWKSFIGQENKQEFIEAYSLVTMT